MVDFKKRLGKAVVEKKTDPREIYNTLDRMSETGPLRPAQSIVLGEWYEKRKDDKNLIIKLHTGEGKTLIGLLILYSRLNQDKGPSLYVCPNKFLVSQVVNEAIKFGIPYCVFNEGDNSFPNDFTEGKRILIIHAQKLFNGLSIFGLENRYMHVGTILLDDSHSCIDIIREAHTIRISRHIDGRDNRLYYNLLNLFEDELKGQGPGDYLAINEGNSDALMQIPYWAWIDRKEEVLNFLFAERDTPEIRFAWELLKNRLDYCSAYISGDAIEIIPIYVSADPFGSFTHATQRILMSATTQDDSFFIKGLGFKAEDIANPIEVKVQKWSGEKMILIPSIIADNLDRDLIIAKFAKPKPDALFGTVVITPSFKQSALYESLGSTVARKDTIESVISNLKSGQYENTIVFVNRYDGIDLPDQTCRILIIDSLPFYISLQDKYEERCRTQSDIQNVKMAQKIEQGLGRSVRGEKDFSVIILIGPDLVRFILSNTTSKYFSPQTRQQISIGKEIVEMSREDIQSGQQEFSIIEDLIKQAIFDRDVWKSFYSQQMSGLKDSESETKIYDILTIEREAEKALNSRSHERASELIQGLLDHRQLENTERGWYLQILARYQYYISKVRSMELQKAAFTSNNQLLCPRDGLTYKKIGRIEGGRVAIIRQWLSGFADYNNLSLFVDDVLNDLSFDVDFDKFEEAMKSLGTLLGFNSQRPDKEYKKGPDNLWCTPSGKYFLIESKNMVHGDRDSIKKSEAAQMNTHIEWFKKVYGEACVFKPIMVITTNKLAYEADMNKQVTVLRKNGLNSLKSSIRGFIKEFKQYRLSEIDDETLQKFIDVHNLSEDYLWENYSENVKNS